MKKSEVTTNFDDYDYMGNAASVMECTGLIPAGPVTEDCFDAYESIYRFEPPAVEIKDTPPADVH